MSPLALSLRFLQFQPDSRLVSLAAAGHEPAFEALVRRYRRELLAYCRRLRSTGAEDAVQQTFLQAWRALQSGAEVRDTRAWLYRIAHNVTLNQLRRPPAVPHELPDAADGRELGELVEQRIRARAALAELASLPDLQRRVMVSTAIDGASHEEVATALGLSTGAVRGLIYRARVTLRSAAAAITPTPTVSWMIRRAERRTGASHAIEAMAGGGGAGVAAALAKGGAVITLAGAVAGAGGVVLTHGERHRGPGSRAAGLTRRQPTGSRPATVALADERGSATRAARGVMVSAQHRGRAGAERARAGDEHGGSGGRSGRGASGGGDGGTRGGGSDDGTSSGSSGGSERGSGSRVTTTLTGGGGGGSGDGGGGGSSSGETGSSSGGSDGGLTTTSAIPAITTSGSDGGTSGGGPGPDSGQLTIAQPTALSGSDGGSSGGSDGSSTSGDGTTATSH